MAVVALELLLGSVAVFFLNEPSWLALVQHATMHCAHKVVNVCLQDPSKLMLRMQLIHRMHSFGSMFAKHL